MLAILGIVLTQHVVKRKSIPLQPFDHSHLVFLALAAFSTVLIGQPLSASALVASCVYFACFLAIRQQMSHIGFKATADAAVFGSILGIAWYLLLVLAAIAAYGPPSGLGYYSFTVEIARSVDALTGARYDFEAKAVMRNAMGEIFALIAVLPLVLYKRPTRAMKILCCVALALVLLSFSRRAAINVAIVLLFVAVFRGMSMKAVAGIVIGISSTLGGVFVYAGVENRFVDLTATSRLDQIGVALGAWSQQVFTGAGYAAQLQIGPLANYRFVHNWWVGNAYMLGIAGFLVSGWITYILYKRLFERRYCVLLLIPAVGMLVGSPVAGMYAPAQWIILALCFAHFGDHRPPPNRSKHESQAGVLAPR